MKVCPRVQRDLFASQSRPPQLVNFDRLKAIALLQALLMEAAIDRALGPANDVEQEAGDE